MPYCAWCGTEVARISYAPCPSCGNPTNGARRAAQGKDSSTAAIVAIVVVGLLVVVAVIGILAAIAIPNLLTAMQRSKQKRTMADMRSIATAVEAYAVDKKTYPHPDALEQELVPTYISAFPRNDGWDHPFTYDCWSSTNSDRCDSYAIASAGKDGVLDHDSPDQYVGAGAVKNFDADIVMIDGQFVQYPEGTAN